MVKDMQKARYLNPKYERRRKRRRVLLVAGASALLIVCSIVGIWRVDDRIRATMLPSAPPVAELRQTGWREYEFSLLGRQYSFSTDWVSALTQEFSLAARTPPAPVRLAYQLFAYTTGLLPRNVRENPRTYSDL